MNQGPLQALSVKRSVNGIKWGFQERGTRLDENGQLVYTEVEPLSIQDIYRPRMAIARAMTIPGTRVSLIFREAMQGHRPNPPVPRNEVASSSNAGLPPPSQAEDADDDPPLSRPRRRWPRPAYQPPHDETLIGDSEDDEPRISNLEFRQQVMQHIRQMEAKMQQFERRLRLATPQTSEPAALGSFDGAEASCVVM